MKAVFYEERHEDGSFSGEQCWECNQTMKIMVETEDGNIHCKGCLEKMIKVIDEAYQDHDRDPRSLEEKNGE